MKRKEFIQKTALFTAASGLAGVFACTNEAKTSNDLDNTIQSKVHSGLRGVQLYTVRNLLKEDFYGTLTALKNAGITDLEFAGYYNQSPADILAFCSQNDLKVPSSHFQFNLFFDNPDEVIRLAKEMNHRYIVLPWLPEEMRTKEVFNNVISVLNEMGPKATDLGMKLCYHNHDFEFLIEHNGISTFERMFNETDPDHVFFELDLFWTVHAGKDPIEILKKAPERFPLCHVKDRKSEDGSMVSVGEGDIDFKAIFEAHDFEHYFIEHDNPMDALASVAFSSAYLKNELNFI
jgi:sugar phosphate isomerase/epimerase